jgi:hypothetical protein
MLTSHQYKNIKHLYWIGAFIYDRNDSSGVVFSVIKPKQMNNNSMSWYTPTWEELNNHNQRLWGEAYNTKKEQKISRERENKHTYNKDGNIVNFDSGGMTITLFSTGIFT